MKAKRAKELIYYFPWAGRCAAISRKAGLLTDLGRQMLEL